MNTIRMQAEENYKNALAAFRLAETCSEAVYQAAKESLQDARKAVVTAELSFPTTNEERKASAVWMRGNKGLEVSRKWG